MKLQKHNSISTPSIFFVLSDLILILLITIYFIWDFFLQFHPP